MMRFPPLYARVLVIVLLLVCAWRSVVWAAPAADEIYLPALAGPPNDSLNVAPQPDGGRAASLAIPLNGGEIVATAANGTRFTLTIPPGALAQTTTITLTPVVEIGGLPAVQLVGAVEIQPLNLWLLEAATLEIEPTVAVPVTQEYPFAYYGAGRDFHPYPIQPYSEGLIFPVAKFDGGYGIAQESAGANAASTAALAFTPADPEAQLRSQISQLIQAERENVLQGGDPDPAFWGKILDLMMEYYNTAIKPLLPPSTVDCDFAEANMGKVVSWLRSASLLFGESTEPGADARFAAAGEEIIAALIKSIENCYLKAAAPCLDWEDPQQVSEVFRFYRMLLLFGAEGNVPAPEDLPECIFVDVQLQGGAFHYEFVKDPETGYDSSVHFQFVDDNVSGFGIYNPYFPPNEQGISPTAIVSMTALIDDVWQPVPLNQRFFCRDKKAERLQELVITYAQTSGGEPLPPQVYADNIGCWRWAGTVRHDQDYDNLGPSTNYYIHVSGDVTLEQKSPLQYFPTASQGEIFVSPIGYALVSPGSVTYDYKLEHFDQDGNRTCLETLNETLENPGDYVEGNFPAISLPNAGFGKPREVDESLGSELSVNLPYNSQGTTCPNQGDSLDVIQIPLAGDLSADGKHITLDESGPLGEGSGTFVRQINLEALRE